MKVYLTVLLVLRVTTSLVTGQSCTCGTNRLGSRIIGGREAPPNKYPWIAALVTTKGHQFCAGALINDRYILTASHCMDPRIPREEMRVALGAHNLKESPPLVLEVESFKKHPKYTGESGQYKYDVALMKLKESVEFSDIISPVCLAPESLEGFDNLMAAGWGKTAWNGQTSPVLREVELTEVCVRDCKRSLGSRVNEAHVCTRDPGRNVCQGDSGGPLVSLQNGYYYEAGIVSWGIRCGDRNDYPSVYTRVSKYVDWIQQNARDAVWCSNPRPVPESPPKSSSGGFNFPKWSDNIFKFFLGR